MTPFGKGIGQYLNKKEKNVAYNNQRVCNGRAYNHSGARSSGARGSGCFNSLAAAYMGRGVGRGGRFLCLPLYEFIKIRLSLVLIVLYAALFLLSIAAPDSFAAVAFDAGG